jgi:membrane protein YqaA with SNARE-associated domain
MIHHFIEEFSSKLLQAVRNSRWFLPVLFLLAVASTLSMLVPFTSILVIAVLAQPSRWRSAFCWGSAGSALGGSIITLAFHQLGWNQIYERFPEFASSQAWQDILLWTATYGLRALAAIAALPLPQTPALIFCSISQQPLWGVFVALFVGKFVKYGVVAATVSVFPERFMSFIRIMHNNTVAK